MSHCQLCGKHTSFGNSVAHIRGGLFSRTRRQIKPNLQKKTLLIDGRFQKVTVCARCIRTANRIRQ
ncbi:MAG: 50S ribosomal protein L28 [Clostridiales bacterium]|nr:50S ribosomal protein L28 [Clostridiales bacterium]